MARIAKTEFTAISTCSLEDDEIREPIWLIDYIDYITRAHDLVVGPYMLSCKTALIEPGRGQELAQYLHATAIFWTDIDNDEGCNLIEDMFRDSVGSEGKAKILKITSAEKYFDFETEGVDETINSCACTPQQALKFYENLP